MLRFTANRKFDGLMATTSARTRTRLLSASGPNAGKSLVALAGLKQAHFTDEDFTVILQWRLGIELNTPSCRCLNAKADGDPCEEMLDCYGDHAVCCPCGPLRIQRHNALTDELADITVETGAHVRREAWIREFANETSDAYLDIWAFGSTDVVDLLIDVTIRHPMSAAYQPAASSLRGAAATTGESGKRARYPAAHGRAVTPFAVETWGRFGDDAEGLLQRLVAAATRRQAIRGHACMPGSIMTRWRAALDAVLQRGVAKS